MDAMRSPEEKQAYLEPLIDAVRRDPVGQEDVLVFLLIALEPVRRGVSGRFIRAHGGVSHADGADWRDRTQARMIQEIERQTLYDVTREGIVEAIFRYPTPPPDRLFPWFRTVVSRQALFQLRKDLTDDKTSMSAAESEALQLALVGLDDVEPPAMRDRTGLGVWRRSFALRAVYETVEAFYDQGAVRRACTAAIGRLPRGQAEVIDGRSSRTRRPTSSLSPATSRGARSTTTLPRPRRPWRATTASSPPCSSSAFSAIARGRPRSRGAIRTVACPTGGASSSSIRRRER
jgi:hypothetical protein